MSGTVNEARARPGAMVRAVSDPAASLGGRPSGVSPFLLSDAARYATETTIPLDGRVQAPAGAT